MDLFLLLGTGVYFCFVVTVLCNSPPRFMLDNTNNDGDNIYVVKDAPIPAKSALETLGGGKMVLEASDLIKVTSSAASSIDVALSIMEITS